MSLKIDPCPEGFKRQFSQCLECDQAAYHDFVPYGIGRGMHYNLCICRCVSGNGYNNAKKITRKEFEKLFQSADEKGSYCCR